MIELVYFRDCPNIAPARERLARALSDLDLCASWWEWDRNADDTPARLRAYGSPTILVNGLPVGGEGVEATGTPAVSTGTKTVDPTALLRWR